MCVYVHAYMYTYKYMYIYTCIHTYVYTHIYIYRASQVAHWVKNTFASAGDVDSVPVSGRSPGGGHGYPLQHPCLENPMDRGAWRATAHVVTKSWTQRSELAHTRAYTHNPPKAGILTHESINSSSVTKINFLKGRTKKSIDRHNKVFFWAGKSLSSGNTQEKHTSDTSHIETKYTAKPPSHRARTPGTQEKGTAMQQNRLHEQPDPVFTLGCISQSGKTTVSCLS